MKRVSIALLLLVGTFAVKAQDNKPTGGNFGIGYGVSFFPTEQHVNLTYYINERLEIGGTIGFQFHRHRSSTFDSVETVGNNFTTFLGNHETKTVTTSASVFIAPMVLYHFPVKNNLDVYLGGNLPITIGTPTKTVNSDIVTGPNYNSTFSSATKSPVSVGIGAGLLVGCQYFFYKNLALGAEANLGFDATITNGYNVTTTSGSNTGSNNPGTGINIPTNTGRSQVKEDDQNLGMLHSFALSLSWYFGVKSKKE